MLKDEFTPSESNHTYDFPKEWYGKKVILRTEDVEVKEEPKDFVTLGDLLPKDSPKYDWLKDVPYCPDFPSIEEIRKTAWPDSRWKR